MKLTKSASDRKIAGVCGGLAEYFGLDSTLIRVIWVIFTLMGGSGILFYLVAMLLMPEPETFF